MIPKDRPALNDPLWLIYRKTKQKEKDGELRSNKSDQCQARERI